MLEKAAQISLVVQAVVVLVSLGFIWNQLRQNAEIAKAGNAQALVDHAMAFSAMLIQSPELARVWSSFGSVSQDARVFLSHGTNTLQDKASIEQYRELLVQALIFHENIYYQHRKGLLDDVIYSSWREDLKFIVKHHNLRIVAKDIEVFFPGDYGRHLVVMKEEPQDPDFTWDIAAQK